MQHKTSGQVYEEPQAMHNWSDILSASGDTTLIPAPGLGRRIVLVYALIQNRTANSTDVSLFQNTSANEFFHWTLVTTGSGVKWIAVLGREARMGENNSVGIRLSGANAHNVNLYWFTEEC